MIQKNKLWVWSDAKIGNASRNLPFKGERPTTDAGGYPTFTMPSIIARILVGSNFFAFVLRPVATGELLERLPSTIAFFTTARSRCWCLMVILDCVERDSAMTGSFRRASEGDIVVEEACQNIIPKFRVSPKLQIFCKTCAISCEILMDSPPHDHNIVRIRIHSKAEVMLPLDD